MIREGYENRFFWTPIIPPLLLGQFRGRASVMGAAVAHSSKRENTVSQFIERGLH